MQAKMQGCQGVGVWIQDAAVYRRVREKGGVSAKGGGDGIAGGTFSRATGGVVFWFTGGVREKVQKGERVGGG